MEGKQSHIYKLHSSSETKTLSCPGHTDYNLFFEKNKFLYLIFYCYFMILIIFNNNYSMKNTVQVI